MALRTASMSGFWDLAATWGGFAPPAGADTFATSTWTVTIRTAGGAVGCAGGTITAGGKLSNQSTAGFTITGAVTWNGTWEVLGSGNNATPTLQTNGGIWSRGAASVANIVGTTGYLAPDVKIAGGTAFYMAFGSRAYATDVMTQVEFYQGGTANNGIFSNTLGYYGDGSVYSDMFFNQPNGKCFGSFTGIHGMNLTGTILISNSSSANALGANINNCIALGTATVKTINNATNMGKVGGYKFSGDITFWRSETAAETSSTSANFYQNARCVLDGISVGSNQLGLYDNSSCALTCPTAATVVFVAGSSVNTTGLVEIVNATNGITLFSLPLGFTLNRLKINVTTGTVTLITSFAIQAYWQATRSKQFDITGATAIVLEGSASVPQYEPVCYRYVIATNMYALQYDMTVGAPNYTALFGTSTGWTAATKTLAAGGVLRILTTGNTATGMDLAIKSFAAAAIAHPLTDTAVVVWTFKVSFDGGVLWSAELTLAQLQADSFIINGNTYTTNGREDIQLEIIGTSAGGGTLTQVRLTGIEIDPYITSSWSVYQNFKDIEGAGFATGTDDLNTIKDTAKAIKNLAGALQ